MRQLGRDIVERLKLFGVAKLDFKRDGAGKLHLLEINPRFTLWHHAAAVAGLNIPALVYADLTGTPRPAATRAKTGVRWVPGLEGSSGRPRRRRAADGVVVLVRRPRSEVNAVVERSEPVCALDASSPYGALTRSKFFSVRSDRDSAPSARWRGETPPTRAARCRPQRRR